MAPAPADAPLLFRKKTSTPSQELRELGRIAYILQIRILGQILPRGQPAVIAAHLQPAPTRVFIASNRAIVGKVVGAMSGCERFRLCAILLGPIEKPCGTVKAGKSRR